MAEVEAVLVGNNLTEGVASQAFSVHTMVRSVVQEQVLQPSAAAKDSPTKYFLSLSSQTLSVMVGVGRMVVGVGFDKLKPAFPAKNTE